MEIKIPFNHMFPRMPCSCVQRSVAINRIFRCHVDEDMLAVDKQWITVLEHASRVSHCSVCTCLPSIIIRQSMDQVVERRGRAAAALRAILCLRTNCQSRGVEQNKCIAITADHSRFVYFVMLALMLSSVEGNEQYLGSEQKRKPKAVTAMPLRIGYFLSKLGKSSLSLFVWISSYILRAVVDMRDCFQITVCSPCPHDGPPLSLNRSWSSLSSHLPSVLTPALSHPLSHLCPLSHPSVIPLNCSWSSLSHP